MASSCEGEARLPASRGWRMVRISAGAFERLRVGALEQLRCVVTGAAAGAVTGAVAAGGVGVARRDGEVRWWRGGAMRRGGATPAGKRRQEAQRAARRGPMAGRPSCASSIDGGRSFTSSHGSPYSLRRRLALVLVLSIPILLISTLDLVTFLPICSVPWILDLRFYQVFF